MGILLLPPGYAMALLDVVDNPVVREDAVLFLTNLHFLCKYG